MDRFAGLDCGCPTEFPVFADDVGELGHRLRSYEFRFPVALGRWRVLGELKVHPRESHEHLGIVMPDAPGPLVVLRC